MLPAMWTQVSCGFNLTVVLTRTGKVFQMGATGANDLRQPAWEGAVLPTQVRGCCLPACAKPRPL